MSGSATPGRQPPPLIIDVQVKPQARSSRLEQSQDGSWRAQLKAAPVEGKANLELIALVARHFGCAKAAVTIKSGASGRRKRVQVDCAPSAYPRGRALDTHPRGREGG